MHCTFTARNHNRRTPFFLLRLANNLRLTEQRAPATTDDRLSQWQEGKPNTMGGTVSETLWQDSGRASAPQVAHYLLQAIRQNPNRKFKILRVTEDNTGQRQEECITVLGSTLLTSEGQPRLLATVFEEWLQTSDGTEARADDLLSGMSWRLCLRLDAPLTSHAQMESSVAWAIQFLFQRA
jgi:hypothetical protein